MQPTISDGGGEIGHFMLVKLLSYVMPCCSSGNLNYFIAFDKERLHNAVAIENSGPFIDTNFSGAKLFRANDVIFIGHGAQPHSRLSLLCLRNEAVVACLQTVKD